MKKILSLIVRILLPKPARGEPANPIGAKKTVIPFGYKNRTDKRLEAVN